MRRVQGLSHRALTVAVHSVGGLQQVGWSRKDALRRLASKTSSRPAGT